MFRRILIVITAVVILFCIAMGIKTGMSEHHAAKLAHLDKAPEAVYEGRVNIPVPASEWPEALSEDTSSKKDTQSGISSIDTTGSSYMSISPIGGWHVVITVHAGSSDLGPFILHHEYRTKLRCEAGSDINDKDTDVVDEENKVVSQFENQDQGVMYSEECEQTAPGVLTP